MATGKYRAIVRIYRKVLEDHLNDEMVNACIKGGLVFGDFDVLECRLLESGPLDVDSAHRVVTFPFHLDNFTLPRKYVELIRREPEVA